VAEAQKELFPLQESGLPEGFRYQQNLIATAEESGIVREIEALPFAPFEFHGFEGKRRVVSFGWRYDFGGGGLKKAEPMPKFLIPLRDAAAGFAVLEPASLQHAMVTEYAAGAAIGWHKDRGAFGDVIGISLVSPCTFRFRRKAGAMWERRSILAQPRSVYLLRGPSRSEWEHSIPAVKSLRYSVTFRSLK
jgi:alkylated DNA repair dioxygenase AlkB